jgi:hypothetical protein
MTSTPPSPPSAFTGTPMWSWLLPTAEETRIRLEPVVTRATQGDGQRVRPLRRLGTVARRALVEEIEARLRTVLGETLAELVLDGWRTHAAIQRAVVKSREEPGVDQVVPLREHSVSADRSHDLDVAVDGVRVLTLTVQLVVRVQLYDAVAVVRDGRLRAVRSGQANANGALTVDGVPVAQRRVTFPLAAELVLHEPRDVSG